MDEPRRIACLHLNQVGDLLFSLPAMHNLRVKYPAAHITSIVRRGCDSLMERTGLADEALVRPHGSVDLYLRFLPQLRRRKLDLILAFSTSEEAWLISRLSGARTKAGFKRCMGGFLFDVAAPWSPPPSTRNNLNLASALGCEMAKADYTGLIHLTDEDMLEADGIIDRAGIGEAFAVLSPGTSTGREIKRWPDERFAEAADRLFSEYAVESAIVGLAGGERIAAMSSHAVDITGRTSLPVLGGVLKRAKLFVGVDSGVMHLAAALGTPVAALFGPTNAEITGPQGDGHSIICTGIDCRPCMKKECAIGSRCMEEITAEMLMDAVHGMSAFIRGR